MKVSGVNTNLSFTAYKSPFSERLESVLHSGPNLLQENLLKIEFRDVFEKHNRKEYSMGAGNYNRVYKIDDFYVMRYPFSTFSPKINAFRRPHNSVQNRIGNCLKTYYGATQAEFGEVQILKNACEDKDFVICQTLEKISNYPDRVNYFTQVYLPAFASLPQSAYDNLACDLKLMNKFKSKEGNSYCYDILNPRNFIKVGDEIRVVDEIENSGTLYTSGNNLATLLDIFFSSTHGILERSYSVEDKENLKNIFIKCILAAENAGLDWGDYEKIAGPVSNYLHNIGVSGDLKRIQHAIKKIDEPDYSKRNEVIKNTLDKMLEIRDGRRKFAVEYL